MLRLLFATAAAALLLAGCGSITIPGLGTLGASPTPKAASKAAQEKAQLDFARCMREHGVNVPDPGSNGPVTIQGGPGDQASMDAAQRACQHFLAAAGIAGGGTPDPAASDRMLKYTRCMREHGVDMPDPQQHGSGATSIQASGAPADPAQIKAADKACHHYLGSGAAGVSVSG